jgi:hypothetical protein
MLKLKEIPLPSISGKLNFPVLEVRLVSVCGWSLDMGLLFWELCPCTASSCRQCQSLCALQEGKVSFSTREEVVFSRKQLFAELLNSSVCFFSTP